MDELELSDDEMLALCIAEPDTAMAIVMPTVQTLTEEMEDSVSSLGELGEEDKNLYILLSVMNYMYETYVDDSNVVEFELEEPDDGVIH